MQLEASGDLFELVKEHITLFDMLKQVAPASFQAIRSREVGHKIPCPFAEARHAKGADKNPSAKFFPETQSVYCWTCHGSWDVISLYAEYREMYRTAEDGTPEPDGHGGYKLAYGQAALALSREYQLDYQVPDWYSRLRRTIGVLKESQREAPTTNQTRKLSEAYAQKLRAATPSTLCAAAVEDYALGIIPDGSWIGIERDMHVWFEWFQELLATTGSAAILPPHETSPQPT